MTDDVSPLAVATSREERVIPLPDRDGPLDHRLPKEFWEMDAAMQQRVLRHLHPDPVTHPKNQKIFDAAELKNYSAAMKHLILAGSGQAAATSFLEWYPRLIAFLELEGFGPCLLDERPSPNFHILNINLSRVLIGIVVGEAAQVIDSVTPGDGYAILECLRRRYRSGSASRQASLVLALAQRSAVPIGQVDVPEPDRFDLNNRE